MTMLMVNIAEAKAKLSEYLDAAARGEHVLICKRNEPIAELRAVAKSRTEPRPVGLARGRLDVPDSFFAPLPDEVIGSFSAVSDADDRTRAAEAPPEDEYARRTRKQRGQPRLGGRRR